MRINEAGENILTRSVDDFRSGRRAEIATDGGNLFAFAENVGDVLIRSGSDLSVLY
jgi:hypothetical protein